MSWIAGIDVSTFAIDVVLLDEDDQRPPQWLRFDLHGPDAWERCRQVRDFPAGMPWDDTIAVGLEVAHGMSSGAVNRVVGAVLSRLPRQLLVKPWTSGEWKKGAGLSGAASKQQVAARSYELGLSPELPQDAHDAHLIALATRAAITVEAAA